jgi:hypothetical protein
VTSTRLAVPLLLAPFLFACGSGPAASPAGPSPADGGSAVAVVDGWTGQPVSASISGSRSLTVSAPGYLTREQAADGRSIALWPASDAYVMAIVYGWDFLGSSRRLLRWDHGFTVTLEGGLAGDAAVEARVDSVLDELRRTTGLPISLGPRGAVTVVVDPAGIPRGALAYTEVTVNGGTMSAARIRFPSRAELLGGQEAVHPNTLLHEIGHVAGLAHSVDVADVMTPAGGPGRTLTSFSPNEAVALRMMYTHRRPGNLPVDRDPGPSAASSRSQVLAIRD